MRVLKNLRDYLLIKRSGLFDLHYYLENNVDVRRADIDPLWHFVNYGWQEGRNPSNDFIVNDYLSANPDVSKSDINPLLHYIKFGLKENRQLRLIPTPLSISEPECDRDLSKCLSLLDKRLKTNNLVLHDLVDIVIPVYNGLEFLPSLFESIINNTDQNFHLILIDDCSTDPGIYPLLENIQELVPGTTLIKHQKNRGFVNSVNEGAMLTQGNFVILNTDTEVPEGWLSRLMYPILNKENVASVTPMTNSGTLVSFPEQWQDNKLFLDCDLTLIDTAFQQIDPSLDIELPTGVGFCMAVNKTVWEEIGPFNELVFGRGYGEENDWCLRAIKSGYRNLVAHNLFVYHKHGGSFPTETKQALSAENYKKLISIHPEYPIMLERFQREDPVRVVRLLALLYLYKVQNPKYTVLFFDHSVGGGANQYRENTVAARLNAGQLILLVTYNPFSGSYKLEIRFGKTATEYQFYTLQSLEQVFDWFAINKIIVNNIATYPNPLEFVRKLEQLLSNSVIELVILIHDYYFVCPSLNLLDFSGTYCDVPYSDICDNCLHQNPFSAVPSITDIRGWRAAMERLLQHATKTIVFSESSQRILLKGFPGHTGYIEVVPHQTEGFEFAPQYSFQNSLSIGVVGVLTYAKGNAIVDQIAETLSSLLPDAKIVIIGNAEPEIVRSNVILTGEYKIEELPQRLQDNEVNLCLFASVCPETFSYVMSELMLLKMPIASFNIGAQAERIKTYPLGKILSQIDPIIATKELVEFYRELKKLSSEELSTRRESKPIMTMEANKQKILTVLSSNRDEACAYLRVLSPYHSIGFKPIYPGSDFIDIAAAVEETDMLLVQRNFPRNYLQFRYAVDQVVASGKPFIFEIDDYLFNLGWSHPEAKHPNYQNALFPMLEALEQADLVTVTTEPLKEKLSLYNDNILVLPNYLDDSIWTLREPQRYQEQSGQITIGYMGGSTHSPDLNFVAPALEGLLKKYGERLKIKFFGLLPPTNLRFLAQVEWLPSISYDYREFANWFQRQTADIFIAPLLPNEFNRYKSCLKYLEYTALGVPGVYTDLEPYNSVIQHGVNGLLAKSAEAFQEALITLIEDDDLRLFIAQNAVADVRDNWLLSTNKHIWQTAYETAEQLSQNRIKRESLLPELNSQRY